MVDKAKVKFIEFTSLENAEIASEYFVSSYQVVHGTFSPAYGYIIKKDTKTIGFSGDSAYCENVDKILEHSDAAVLDVSFIDGNSKHMGVSDIKVLSNKYPDKKIIPTHMDQSARQYLNEYEVGNVIVLSDGDEIGI